MSDPLEEEVVNLDPKKLSLPPELSLKELPTVRITLHEITPGEYYKITIEGNSFVRELVEKVSGEQNARKFYSQMVRDVQQKNYSLKAQFGVTIIPASYLKRHS